LESSTRPRSDEVAGLEGLGAPHRLRESDLVASLEFYRRWFDAAVVAGFTYAGARNVFVAVGSGRLHFYDQPPRSTERIREPAAAHTGEQLLARPIDHRLDAAFLAGMTAHAWVQSSWVGRRLRSRQLWR
jgi:hypothetical protein